MILGDLTTQGHCLNPTIADMILSNLTTQGHGLNPTIEDMILGDSRPRTIA